ncbi:hypothetical protein QZH41_019670 [Actinostola sp. cb2023]|nr:hypothetical protein QZH41_019670 [Actinostola sp. cb2023]
MKSAFWLRVRTIPKNTRNSTRWSVKLFEDWQRSREDITPRNFVSSSIVLDMSKIHDLSTPLHCMNAETLNLWLCRFVEEVCNGKGERYPPRTLYVIVCGLKRYLSDKNGLDPFSKHDERFMLFRKVIDGEMRDATKKGIDLKCKKDIRDEITMEEEELFWRKGLLGHGRYS